MKDRFSQKKEKVDSSKALDTSLVVTECSGTKLEKHDTSSRSESDTHAVDADIRPVNDQVPFVEVASNTTSDSTNMCNRGGEIDQDAKNGKPQSLFAKKGDISETKGPGPKLMTPGTISLGLMQNIPSSTPYVPPTKNNWEILFQSMFDEYLNPPSCVDPQVFAVIAPEHIEAMQEELNEFERLKVWELVPRPDHVMIITLKWIYMVKLDELRGKSCEKYYSSVRRCVADPVNVSPNG
uniref:Retrovirus-related Pol polyprotein from transposon TNT 1-94 n=1 Tax=Tanacetum cinerariifolium TaxID=118510 RepID=A0A6L2K4N9_TANCI|nr:retrovirus-related Pol polyprotein from transposon TNT 1-94 [Tanacetum cinerariifolium]